MSFLGRRRPEAAPDASTLVADSRAWRFLPGIGKVDAPRGASSSAALTLLAPRTDGVDPTPLHRVRYNSSKKGFVWRARRGPSEAEGGARHAALIWADLESW